MRRFVLSSLSLAAAVALSARADQSTSTNTLPPVLVTGVAVPTSAEDLGSSVTVITAEQIQQSKATAVSDLLRGLPGLTIVQQGRPGGQTSVFMRGANSKQTLVLIDGARFNNPIDGSAALANLTPDQVERIEVVRGPQSALYGADAIGGVINIITRHGTGPLTGSLAIEGGSYRAFRETGQASGATGIVSYAMSASHESTDNQFRNDDYENYTVGGKFGIQPTERLKFDATARYIWSDVGEPGVVTNGIPVAPNIRERRRDEIVFGRVGAELTALDCWRQSLYVADTYEQAFDRGNPFAVSNARSDLLEVNWLHNFTLAEWNTFSAGLDWYRNHGVYEVSGAAPFDKSVDDTAGFVEDKATLFRRLTVTGGGRVDHNSRFGTEATFRGNGTLRVDETGTRLKASGGSGFKAPTLNDLFQSFPPFPPFFGAFLANPDLKPERSVGWDAGFEQDLGRCATVSTRYFENDLRNLITSAMVTPPATPPDFTLKNVNRARAAGVETTLEVRPCRDLTLWGNYTWLVDATDLTTGKELLRRPEHSGSVGGDYRFLNRFNLHTAATLVGDRADLDPLTGATIRNPGYVKWDIGLTADVNEHLQILGRVENVLDDRYEEAKGYPALGRTFWVGAVARF